MWKLVIEDDEGKRTVVPLTRDEYSIGRKEGNTIRLTERNVSREHARICKRNGAAGDDATFVLEDLTSYNGVFVNGLRITHAQDLTHGDLVQIGDYRIAVQDEGTAEVAAEAPANDTKQTLPATVAAKASGLLDRPNRLVMLAGPSPGAEFPLDQERLTVGRAEDASISINHNSVSRLHCEVHALGDGRFEIVDKGSSNGVRVNGADLRRGIIEPGDLIELGDVRFKFVGAGQIFRATESQRLATIGDRTASHMVRARRGSSVLPVSVFVAIVAFGAVGAWAYARSRAARTASTAPAAAPPPEQVALDDAKRLCAAGDCEAAHARLEAAVSPSSPFRATGDFRDVEGRWADLTLARADAELDPGKKRSLYQRVALATGVDAAHRKVASDRLEQLEANAAAAAASAAPAVALTPAPSGRGRAEEGGPPSAGRPEAGRRTALAAEPAAPATTLAALPSPAANAVQAAAKAPAGSMDDRERQLALQGTTDAKILLKQQLEQRVYSGRASDTEIKLLISTCKDLGDKPCVQQARATLAQKHE